nr:immunoglobulin light chain junction region [Macaca mulatta]MPO03172.1 immunoglobulin light chain junction region [Macaca mulatta]MPO03265.1 immunoglobulin light chain junction region [Macaca mulatta]MPO03518.1 immunoglobulin light chain junction region [Macaca mulatta]MPO03840.1 immunoglobulin light chain junction region [Macaca mulatta]
CRVWDSSNKYAVF